MLTHNIYETYNCECVMIVNASACEQSLICARACVCVRACVCAMEKLLYNLAFPYSDLYSTFQ